MADGRSYFKSIEFIKNEGREGMFPNLKDTIFDNFFNIKYINKNNLFSSNFFQSDNYLL